MDGELAAGRGLEEEVVGGERLGETVAHSMDQMIGSTLLEGERKGKDLQEEEEEEEGDESSSNFQLGLDCDSDPLCPLCNSKSQDPLLLSCLHSVCRSCKETHQGNGGREIKCERCGVKSSLTFLARDYLHSDTKPGPANSLPQSLAEDVKLVLEEAEARDESLPEDVARLTNSLSELQEERDNVKDLIEESYQSYKAMLEQCKETALEELEARANQQELAIMEKLEDIDMAQGSLEHALKYGKRLMREFSKTQAMELLPQVRTHIARTLERLDSDSQILQTTGSTHSLRWGTDPQIFSQALRATFGSFDQKPQGDTLQPHPLPGAAGDCLQPHPLPGAAGDCLQPPHTEITVSNSSAQNIRNCVIDIKDSLAKDGMNPTPSLGLLTVGSPTHSNLQVPSVSPQGGGGAGGSLSGLVSPHPLVGGLGTSQARNTLHLHQLQQQQRPLHGPIGSSLSSPVHHFPLSRMGASHPDLSVSGLSAIRGGGGAQVGPNIMRGHTPPLRGGRSPPLLVGGRGLTPPLLGGGGGGPQHHHHDTGGGGGVTPGEYSLVQLASMAEKLERSASGPIQPNFTLADLISNVSEEQTKGWDDDVGQPTTPSHALSNLAALAKLDELQEGSGRWHVEHNLLLPDLDRSLSRSHSGLHSDPVSPGTHSVSPVLGGLGVPGLSTRGTSPLSPVDSLMPSLGGMSVSPVPPLRGGLLAQTGGQRALNPMQIRCKFGTLGPGKGQFNSPHGFCLGLEEEIIVADTNNHRIQVFEKNGTYRYQFGIPGKEEGQLWYPRKVAVMKNSGKFVICDRGNERSRMQIFTKNGHFVRKIAIRYIDIVAGLAITREGNIVAVDSVTPTMFVISENGDLLRWFDCADYMREPSDIAVYGSEFFVCDFKGHNVVVFSEDGDYVRRIGSENITNFPNGIDISDHGDILIGDSHGNRFHVAVFGGDGHLLGEFECPHVKVSRCCGLKITTEGYVVTLAKNNHHVLVLNTLYIP